jgi:hypothetical protein
MSTWTAEELDTIGRADELQIASRRADGTLRGYVIIWAVRVGEDLFVRSAHGGDNPWYRRAMAGGVGRIRAGGIEKDVTFESADGLDQAAIDSAYHAKYDQYGPRIVGPVVGPETYAVTIRLVPVE